MRPKVFLLDLLDPEKSLDDPGLRALVEAGWTCSGSWPVVRNDSAGGQERVQLMLLLWPPSARMSITRPNSALMYAYPGLMLMWIAVTVGVVLWVT